MRSDSVFLRSTRSRGNSSKSRPSTGVVDDAIICYFVLAHEVVGAVLQIELEVVGEGDCREEEKGESDAHTVPLLLWRRDHKRTLGKTGWQVSEVGYGAWGLGGNQWRGHKEDDAVAALKRALELGLNFIDTAPSCYGHSEQLIRQTLKETGATARVATKVPPKNKQWPALAGIGLEDVFPYDYVVESTETSLKNLGVETIDLQQFHVWNPEWLAAEGLLRAIEDLKKAGKVRYWGHFDQRPSAGIRHGGLPHGADRYGAGDLQCF